MNESAKSSRLYYGSAVVGGGLFGYFAFLIGTNEFEMAGAAILGAWIGKLVGVGLNAIAR